MQHSSYYKILTGFALVMGAAAVLAATALGWLYHMDRQLDALAAQSAVPAVRALIRQGYGLVVGVGALGTLVSCGCIWWVWSTLGRVLRLVGQALQESSANVLESVSALSRDSRQLAGNATEAAATIGETVCAVEQLAGITARNAQSAGVVKQLAGEAREAVDAGAGEMQSLALAMQEIAANSREVAGIIHVMDEIAFQTNLRALNAAIEAARAGTAGQGFGVVANEVHALAQRSASSAREIADRVHAAGEKTRQGVDLAGRATERLRHVVECNQKLDTLATGVAKDSREQELGIGNLRTACDQLKEVTAGNAATAGNTARFISDLRDEAGRLREAVLTLRGLVEGGAAGAVVSPIGTGPILAGPDLASSPR